MAPSPAAAATEPLRKKTIYTTASVDEAVEAARLRWALDHFDWVKQNGPVGTSAWYGALLQLGLSHVDDPAFAGLLRGDGRRPQST